MTSGKGPWTSALVLMFSVGCGEGPDAAPPIVSPEAPEACTPARWATAGPTPETTEKVFSTLTLLPSGDVLSVGGGRGMSVDRVEQLNQPVAGGAALFSAASGAWRDTGPMGMPRQGHTATALADGRVLAAGSWGQQLGMSSLQPRRDAELYAMEHQTWHSTSPMAQPRADHAAARLADGRVLVAGGWGVRRGEAYAGELDSVELFDPATGTWQPGAPMRHTRSRFAALTLKDGRVLVTGTNPPESYDPSTNTWSTLADMPRARPGRHFLLPLPSGRVMALSEGSLRPDGTYSVEADVYSPESGTWTQGPDLSPERSRERLTAVALADGRVLIVGGNRQFSVPWTEVYDERKGLWSPGPDLLYPRWWPQVERLPGGGALVEGGVGTQGPDGNSPPVPPEAFTPGTCP